ncbi:hypothetical protein ASE69_15065 [Sphingomonas sp. Leaf208]|nr:hypothetical protein ASE69_15065 [Sphingomonas sp. Leaf208]
MVSSVSRVCRGARADIAILPRQGEVSPKGTEGEDTEQRLARASPSVRLTPATSPWRERIVK